MVAKLPTVGEMRDLARRMVRHDPEPGRARKALRLLLDPRLPAPSPREAHRALRVEVERFVDSDSTRIPVDLRLELATLLGRWGRLRRGQDKPRVRKEVFFEVDAWDTIVEAARKAGRPVTYFVRDAAREAAERVLTGREGG